jgi:hypothetical protein
VLAETVDATEAGEPFENVRQVLQHVFVSRLEDGEHQLRVRLVQIRILQEVQQELELLIGERIILTGSSEALRHLVVLGTRCRVAARMVVREDDCAGVGEDGGFEDFARVNEGAIECPATDLVIADHLVLGREHQDGEDFDGLVLEQRPEDGRGFGGLCDDVAECQRLAVSVVADDVGKGPRRNKLFNGA